MNNPFLEKNTQPYNSVPFELINSNHFLPAIKHYIKVTEENIENICNNQVNPNFENTIVAFESADEDLDYVVTVYHHMFSSEADDKIKELIKEINPLTTKLYNDIFLNEVLFNKIKIVYSNKNKLNNSDSRLLEEVYYGFVKSGANLNEKAQNRYREISQKLSALSPQFSNNVLSATNSINDYWISDKNNLKGLPENIIESAKNRAKIKNKPEKWCFSLDTDAYVFILFCENRNLRKDIVIKSSTKCNGGEFNNNNILKKISQFRHERANLLGFDTHADFILDRRMANSKEIVYDFINKLIAPSFRKAQKELDEIGKYAKKIDGLSELKSYDFQYYREKYKQYNFSFNEEVLRPYFKAENVVKGAFTVANKLYGLNFELLDDVQKFHKEVKVYKVTDENSNYLGLLYQDLHPRETKRGGAWMNQLRAKGLFKGKDQQPHVTLNCNLTRSTEDKPALLSINEVRTIFHEFGHCLHGLLTDVKYKTLGALGVYWDFVELPSQILENWLKEPEVLNIFAKHYKSGKSIPSKYIEKINESKKYMLGMFSLMMLHYCKIDMSWHDGAKNPNDIEKFEKDLLKDSTLIPKEKGSAVSSSFSHIFAGGYSAGYYSYKWAELLEADAFSKFKEDGIFNKETAQSFRNNILSKGNTDHPMNLFKNFMGREPDITALLNKFGINK